MNREEFDVVDHEKEECKIKAYKTPGKLKWKFMNFTVTKILREIK